MCVLQERTDGSPLHRAGTQVGQSRDAGGTEPGPRWDRAGTEVDPLKFEPVCPLVRIKGVQRVVAFLSCGIRSGTGSRSGFVVMLCTHTGGPR